MPLSEDAHALAHRLIDGAEKTFANAEALFQEATILANSGAWPRALFLHQIALEECAKVDSLGAAVISVFMGHEVDLDRLRRAFRRHEYKNKANAYWLPVTENERQARDSGDFGAAREAFKQLQADFHEESNDDKNASLYVDFAEAFTSPLDIVSEEDFAKVRGRNEEFMSIAFQHIRMLRGYAGDLDRAAADVTEALSVLGITDIERGGTDQFKPFLDSFDDKLQELVRKRRAELGGGG